MTDFVVRYIAFNWWESNLNYLNKYTEKILTFSSELKMFLKI